MPLSEVVKKKGKEKLTTVGRVNVLPNPNLKADEIALDQDAVNFALGGHLSPTHRARARRMLTQMRNSGLTTDKYVSKAIRAEGLNLTGKQVRNAIRDMIVNEPGQRQTDDGTVKTLIRYLKSKNVNVRLD